MERAAELIRAAMIGIRDAGGSLPLRDVKSHVAKTVTLTPDDLERFETTGNVRWESVLHFYSVDCVKAGFIRKKGGRWFLTPEGEEALKMPPIAVISEAKRRYRAWKNAQTAAEDNNPATVVSIDDAVQNESADQSLVLENAVDTARNEIEEFVRQLGPYEFQELVAALLRGMGYSTPLVAGRGPDGGTDILAYPDPLGAETPHIRVQVKHRSSQKATREEVAALRGIIRTDREIGLFVSSGGFTSQAQREASSGTVHIELMDMQSLLDRWVDHYDSTREEDRALLRLQPVYFLAPD